jgi:hypothetical protein
MPAWEEEIQAAETEGVRLTYLSAPQEILVTDGRVTGLALHPHGTGRTGLLRTPSTPSRSRAANTIWISTS